MTGAAQIIIGLIAAIHLYILWLEMFAWTTFARKTFMKFPAELFEKTKPMAANQGLYNGFLASGLIWSLFIQDVDWSVNVASFFLGCVLVAGIFGAYTVQRTILFVQAVPALLGLLIIYFKI
jgi:putative membrane protein